ncbi:hypothetical protein PB2503_13209 [Parvularcula bermudensis HTCC2503]|uniref:DUF1330 domain-containing protein n=1 Tax=Parvularcula bermudensis (strain ATCC BAA-594 / HTCC2503 / KCTC 12087) TaxID=314260 RepID=E0TGS0_PARBH|nr:DUF1330 domain-containing protein [Parvularcula bermudensis]ADM10679.1 hypothetical protein PB2503_13209 [Parvularcula bermudensis HTCC2503]
MTFIDPTREQFSALAKGTFPGPVHMLNLIKYRQKAAYEDGREATGAEAYAAYGRASAPIFHKAGGSIIWRGVPLAGVIGPADEKWDLGFIAAYPSKDHFLAMVKDEAYQAIVFHRQAAVETSRLVAFSPREGGDRF